MTPGAVAVVGGGRVGQSLARALVRLGRPTAVLARTPRTFTAPLGPAVTDWSPAVAAAADLIVIAVPDDAVGEVAARLDASGAVSRHQVILHCSGRHDRSALAPLEHRGAALGSWHPVVGFRDEATELAGVAAVIEGDARALRAARALAQDLGMAPIREITAAAKPGYHAAAVFASNYLVVMAAIADRLTTAAGVGSAAELFGPLMRRAVDDVVARGPRAALTGPILRGDVATVRAHLDSLDAATAALYRALGREALELAATETSPDAVAELRRLLSDSGQVPGCDTDLPGTSLS